MKLMEKMKKKRLGNKGFSLVELIIVIAIMAILIGLIGTQVVPYLNRARVERDMQVINSYSTAAVTFYAMHTEEFVNAEANPDDIMTFVMFEGVYGVVRGTIAEGPAAVKIDIWEPAFIELTGYTSAANLRSAMSTTVGKNDITAIAITYNFGTTTKTNRFGVEVPAGAVTVTALNNNTPLLEPATSYIKGY